MTLKCRLIRDVIAKPETHDRVFLNEGFNRFVIAKLRKRKDNMEGSVDLFPLTQRIPYLIWQFSVFALKKKINNV